MHTETANITLLGTATGTEERDTIRIYVACLAAYNSGHLHGRWIDVAGGFDHIWDEVNAMLAASPVEGAEEWAIHDHEGFEGVELHESENFADICRIAAFIENHGALGGKLVRYFSGEIDEAKAAFEDYAGKFRSLAAFAEDMTLDSGIPIPKTFEYYIDWQAMGRDMEMSGDIFTIETGFEQLHVFWSR